MFKNTFELTGFALRRERVSSTVWIFATTIFNALVLLLFIFVMVPDPKERLDLMAMFENPALLAMVGPLNPELGVNSSNMGYIYTLFMMVMCAIVVGIMNVFLIVRHTRNDEELGRFEVLRSLPSGRLSNLNAAMFAAFIINILFALFFALSMFLTMALGNEGVLDYESALLWGVNMGVTGLFFASVAAIFSQLSSTARGALSYSFFMLGLFYMIRAVADMDMQGDSEIFAYFSPFGLISRTWPYVDNTWLPVYYILGATFVCTVLAYLLCSVRDLGQGFIPARPGKAKGGLLMRSAFGLNIRLLRTSVFVWIIILFLTAASYGSVLENIEDFVAGSQMYRDLMLAPIPGMIEALKDAPLDQVADMMNQLLAQQGYNIVQMFANMIGFVMAMMAAIPVLMFILKAKNEETAMRAELIFATPVSRTRYLTGFIALSFVTAVLVQLAQAVGMYSLAVSMGFDDKLPLEYLLESTLVYVPALWVMGGLTAVFVGLFPRRANWIWAFYGYTFFVMMYGRMLPDLKFLHDFTPMGWVPQLPVDDINWVTMGVLTAIAIFLSVLGIVFYNKRDIGTVAG